MAGPQRLTDAELERLRRKFALEGTPALDKAVNDPALDKDEDFLTKVEGYTSNPWVQGGLIAGSLLTGGVPAAILGGAEAVSAGVSAYNRYREGNLGQAALTAALGGLGGAQAVRGARNVVKGAQIAKAGAAAGKTFAEIQAARKAANLDPSWMSPELRWVKGKLESRAATRAAGVPPGTMAAPSRGPMQGPQGGPIGNPPRPPTHGVRKPPTTASMASTLDKLRKSNPEMTEGIDRLEEVLSAQASKPKGAAARVSTTREVADAIRSDVPKPTPAPTRGTVGGPTSLTDLPREKLLPILHRLQAQKSKDPAVQATIDRVLAALRKKPGPTTGLKSPLLKAGTVAEDFGRAAKPGETAPLSFQSAMDTLARLRRKNPELSEGIDLIESSLAQPRVRGRTEGLRPSRAKAAVAARVATTPTRTAKELKKAMEATLRGETPVAAKAPGPVKPPTGGRPKPGEPGGRRLTAFEKAMRAKGKGGEPPAPTPVTPKGKPKGPTTPTAAAPPKALGAEYDAYSAKVDQLIKAEEFLADATPGSTVHTALTNRVAMLRNEVDKAFEIYKAKLPGGGRPVAQPVAAGGRRGPRKAAEAIGTRAGRVEKLREEFGGTPPPAAKPAATPPPQVVKGPELGIEAGAGTNRAGTNVQPRVEMPTTAATVELPVPAGPGTTVAKVPGKQAPAGKGNVHRVTFANGKSKDIYFDRRKEMWFDETGAITGKTRGDIVKQLEDLNNAPVPASTTPAPLPGQLPPEPAFGPRLILQQLREKSGMLKKLLLTQQSNSKLSGMAHNIANTQKEIAAVDRRITELAAKYDAPPVPPAAAPVKDVLTEVRETFQPAGAPPPPPVPEPRSIRRPYASNEPAGREPWTAPAPARTPPGGRGRYPRPPKPEAPPPAAPRTAAQIKAELKAAEAEARAANKALKKSTNRGMPSPAKTDTALKAAAAGLRGRATALNPKLAPAAGKLADALTQVADNIAEAANKAPRLIGKGGERILPKGKNLPSDAGSLATDLMELMARLGIAGIGGTAGMKYGEAQAPEGEDKTGYRIAGAGTGALLGFLGSTAAINKLKGGSLANMAKRYNYFSLLSDPSVLGRATLGSMNSIFTGMAEKLAEGEFKAVGRGVKRLLKDTAGMRYFRVLAARDQSLHLPAAMRVNYQGRAAVGPGYKVLDLPGRVITAADTMASRTLHEMGFGREAVMRLNLGGNPQTKLGQRVLQGLGEDVTYQTWTKGRTTKGGRRIKGGGVTQPKYTPPKLVEKIAKGKSSPAGDLARRALIPFARMTVGLGERTMAYMPGVNMLPWARRAFAEIPTPAGVTGLSKVAGQSVPLRVAAMRSALGAGSVAGGYYGSEYTDPHNDAWLTALAGPMAGLAGIGVALRRMQEKDQPIPSMLMQQIQNLAPGVGEQLSPQIEKIIPSAAKVFARAIDPAYDRAKGPSEIEEELKKTGDYEGSTGTALERTGKWAAGQLKYRIPKLRETLPEKYRPADKWGQPLYDDRHPFAFQMIPDTSLRGTIGGYRIIAPKLITGSSNIELPKWPVNDPISQHLRQLENVTGQTIMSPPSQPLRDPELTMIARILHQTPKKLHRDMKEAIQGARGMAPRQPIAALLADPAFLEKDPQIQAMILKDMVDKSRQKAGTQIKDFGKTSISNPELRPMLIEALRQYQQGLRGPF